MIRNKELIREILLYLETLNTSKMFMISGDDIKGFSQVELIGHLKLLQEDGYINGKPNILSTGVVLGIIVHSITMKGHDYIDSIRDEGIWAKVKKN